MGFWDWLMGTPPTEQTMPARRGSALTPAAKRASVFNLQVGDVVSYDDIDYLVKNKITWEEDGDRWYDYLLVDDATESEIWLSAEDDDGIQLGIYREIDVDFSSVPKTYSYEGQSFRQVEHSEANVSLEREDASRDSTSSVEYWEFEGPNDRYLSVSRWGNQFEASVGSEIEEYELKVYPAEPS